MSLAQLYAMQKKKKQKKTQAPKGQSTQKGCIEKKR